MNLAKLFKLPKKLGDSLLISLINNMVDYLRNYDSAIKVDDDGYIYLTSDNGVYLNNNLILDKGHITTPLSVDNEGNLYIDQNQFKTINNQSIFGTGSINLGYIYDETALSISEGGSIAKASRSHAEGNQCTTEVSAVNSHVEGYKNIVNGVASHAEGRNNTTTNEAEHAEGKYNKSIQGQSLHTVGNGTSTTAKNAHLITVDGKHYIPGVGGYTGTETSLENIKDLASFIATLQEKAPMPIIQIVGLNSSVNLDIIPGLGRYTMIVDYRNGDTSLAFVDGIISNNYEVFITRNEDFVQDFYYLDVIVIPKSVLATNKDIIICSPYRLIHSDY